MVWKNNYNNSYINGQVFKDEKKNKILKMQERAMLTEITSE